MTRVLFLCSGNSARSQLAEALLRRGAGEGVSVASAGTEPVAVHPLTIEVLAERGIDVRDATSDHVDRYVDEPWDYVITVCDRAAESCPAFPGETERRHWSFPDPAAAGGDRGKAFRDVRDAMERRIETFAEELARTERGASS